MTALSFLFAACGGGLGALCRGLMTRFLKRHTPSEWPFATLIVNLIACGLAGFFMPANLSDAARLAITVGFLGGFSTLATMNYEAASLFRDKRYLACLLYLAVTYATTFGSAALGYALAGVIMG